MNWPKRVSWLLLTLLSVGILAHSFGLSAYSLPPNMCQVGLVNGLDVCAPSASIDFPKNGQVIKTPYVMSGSASDNIAVSKVEISVDGGSFVKVWPSGTPQNLGAPVSIHWSYRIDYLDEKPHSVVVRATDNSSNQWPSPSVNFRVDNTPPTFPSFINPLVVEADSPSGKIVDPLRAVDDNLNNTSCNPSLPHQFPIGNTTVTCTATDLASNSKQVSFVVQVMHTVPPVLSVPSSTLDIRTLNPSNTRVNYTVTASDSFDRIIPIECEPMSGAIFPVGQTTVSCKATDSYGISSSKQFVVKVESVPDSGIDWTVIAGVAAALGVGGAIAYRIFKPKGGEPIPPINRDSLRQQLAIHQRNLQDYNIELASYGGRDVPVKLLRDIDYTKEQIANLTKQIGST